MHRYNNCTMTNVTSKTWFYIYVDIWCYVNIDK